MATFFDALEKYVQDEKNHPLTLQRFVDDNLKILVSNIKLDAKYQQRIATIFSNIIKRNNVEVVETIVDWSKAAEAFLAFHFTSSSTSAPAPAPSEFTTTPANDSSSKSSNKNKKLTDDNKKIISKMFNDLDDNKMWQLSTGKKVEHQMKKMALGVTHEHLACSLVLDPDDKDWLNYFTKQELEEIKNESVPVISTLPKPLLEYIDKYKGLKSLDEIRNINIQHNFHPLQEPDLHWIDSSISKVLDIMYYKYLAKRRSESDLMKHIWVLIDTCFYASTIDAISGETSSKSTSNRVNHVQSTTTDSSSPSSSSSAPSSSSPPPTESLSSTMARKQIGNKTDIRFATEVFEFGTVEAGKESNITSKKTIIESGFKIPKILKDMFIQLLKESPTSVREIKTFGFTLSGISMLPQILDCPQGYVCRMNRTQKWLHYPSGPEDFVPRMKSLITVVHHMKTLATMMLDVISDSDSNVQFGSSAIDIQIPACFSPSVSTTNKRKKQSTNDSSNKKTKTDQA